MLAPVFQRRPWGATVTTPALTVAICTYTAAQCLFISIGWNITYLSTIFFFVHYPVVIKSTGSLIYFFVAFFRQLSNMHLYGTIPRGLMSEELTNLWVFREGWVFLGIIILHHCTPKNRILSNNQLSGTIPEDIDANVSNLMYVAAHTGYV